MTDVSTDKNNEIQDGGSGTWKVVLGVIIALVIIALGGFIYFQHQLITARNGKITTLETEKQTALSAQDSMRVDLEGVTQTVTDVAMKLQDVRKKRALISDLVARAQTETSKKDQILNDIAAIEAQLDRDRTDIDALNTKVRQSGVRIKSLETMVNNLKKELESNISQVANLRSIIEDKNEVIRTAETKLKQTETSLATVKTDLSKTNEALEETKGILQETKNTAYYVVGTKDELKEKNILDEQGAFFQKKSLSLSGGFDESSFTRIDLTKQTEFPVACTVKDVKVLPLRSETSFQLIETGENQSVIKVTDPEKFWRIKYLAVVVKG